MPFEAKWKSFVNGSFFIRLALFIADFFEGIVSGSFLYKFFTTYPSLEEQSKNSIIKRIFVDSTKKLRKNLGLGFSRIVENSVIANTIDGLVKFALRHNMLSYAAFFTAFGLVLISIVLYNDFVVHSLSFASSDTVIGFGFVFVGLFFSLNRDSLGTVLMQSKVFRFLFLDLLSIREEVFKVKQMRESIFLFSFLGICFGTATIYAPLLYILAAPIAIVLALSILAIPETGFILLLFAAPFIETMMAAAFAAFVVISFAFKVLRSKRKISIGYLDLFVLFFMTLTFVMGGLLSLYPSDSILSVALYVLFISTYFVAANGIRNKKYIMKSIIAILTGGFISSALGIYQNFFSEASSTWVDADLFEDISIRVVGTFGNPNVFGEYLVMIIPLAISLIFLLKGKNKIPMILCAGAMLTTLVFTWSRGAWLAMLVALVLFLFMYKGLGFKFIFPALCALPLLPVLLPDSITSRIMSIGDMTDSSTAYRFSIYTSSLRLILDYFFTGIGVGATVFSSVYAKYALSGAVFAQHSHNLYMQILAELGVLGALSFIALLVNYARLILTTYSKDGYRFYRTVALALGLGLVAVLFQGLTDHVWYNYRIYLYFWMIMGLSVGVSRAYFYESSQEEVYYHDK